MKQDFDPKNNYEETKNAIGFVALKDATQNDWTRIGFMSGLEVHQQLKTKQKLFCHCPAGIFQKKNQYDAELIRHMRPTLSELGEYDGTALMEFKTRKEIIYRIKNETACTYDVDDTPPFKLNKEALEYALEISLLNKLNIVGEVHITRKQYLDGSIPTGFQRTAILGVEGEIPLKNKKIRLIQLSIEEDSCREISDIGHVRIYTTDRLGTPLIETVTYPDMLNPYEVKEACDYIRFLNRSTGKVRTGIGAGRQDVNVSCKGGTRVEIKGVSHTRWIPKLTHNEAFRQWALLHIQEILKNKFGDGSKWKMNYKQIDLGSFHFSNLPINDENKKYYQFYAINLPGFKKLLSHFTQPGKMFADEFSERLKVIACIEQPNMTHSEEFQPFISEDDFSKIRTLLEAESEDAQIILWGPENDMKTALETVEERCKWAFNGVPNETRKSFEDGTTIFERVLPGADRMYPDTDSVPIPLHDEYINSLKERLPEEVMTRYQILKKWNVPEDTYNFIFKKNLFPVIEKIVAELGYNPKFMGTFFGQTLKFVEGHYEKSPFFCYEMIYDLFSYIKKSELDTQIAKKMLPVLIEHPKMDFDSILATIKFKKISKAEILSDISFMKEKFSQIQISNNPDVGIHWIMGNLRKKATGNINLAELKEIIETTH
ncbi:MAG: Glu-tRNA(Gln) amidotransferase subunit GatE [Bacteroidales bacterium]|jgi:glutamyl-tRNA(Gln) amidotransferase subunit E|nr:Glu-tRNA(Gln) amidotransferase subunit GatE [Bacteroidales bacterium]MDD4214563.1 Glu-tRNA(Gln) amidotransferase subunit GatE [Bacteroidales bacterium]